MPHPVDVAAAPFRDTAARPEHHGCDQDAPPASAVPSGREGHRDGKEKPFGWWLLAFVFASALAWLAMAAVFLVARDHWGLPALLSAAIALVGAIPVLGNAAGAYAAMIVWGWHPAIGALVFFGSVLLVAYPAWLQTQPWRGAARPRARRPAA